MSKLVNLWNGLAVFLGAMGGSFILLDHLTLGIVFLVISGILALIPAFTETKELGKYYAIIIPSVVVISFGVLAYILLVPKPQTSAQPKQQPAGLQNPPRTRDEHHRDHSLQ